MQLLSSAVIAFFDLVHSEYELLHKRVLDTVVVIILFCAAAAAIFTGAGFLIATAFSYLKFLLPAPYPSLAISIFCFVIGGGLTWVAIHLRK